MMLRKKKPSLQVHIVEQHNNVLPFIHRAIASRRLPFNDIAMLHFDSHPDLLLPPKLKADTIFQPHVLYEELSIENWLLPLTYAKHVNNVIWVKPPWASQIKCMKEKFTIGKCVSTGYVRLTSKENYFLTDGLFQSKKDLDNTMDVDLMVLELLPEKWSELDAGYSVSASSPSQSSDLGQHLQDLLKETSYILDVDLDFFSTANPFKNMLKPDEEKALRNLYQYSKLNNDPSDDDVLSFTKRRYEQLYNLESMFDSLERKWSNNQNGNLKRPSETDLEDLSFTDLINTDCSHFNSLSSQSQSDLEILIKAVLKVDRGEDLNFQQIHDFGCTLDDTELPHHISTDNQIAALVNSFTSLIEKLPRPSIVTIARSSDDEYCPKSQVDKCQECVISLLERLYGPLDISYDLD